jgi:hypothetical protein
MGSWWQTRRLGCGRIRDACTDNDLWALAANVADRLLLHEARGHTTRAGVAEPAEWAGSAPGLLGPHRAAMRSLSAWIARLGASLQQAFRNKDGITCTTSYSG